MNIYNYISKVPCFGKPEPCEIFVRGTTTIQKRRQRLYGSRGDRGWGEAEEKRGKKRSIGEEDAEEEGGRKKWRVREPIDKP